METPSAGREVGSRLVRVISSGSSGATVYLLEQPDGSVVAAKVARRPRVNVRSQALRRDLVAQHLDDRTPAVLSTMADGDIEVIVSEAPGACTLDEAIDRCGPSPELRQVWQSVVRHLTAMWRRTARPGFDPHLATRNHERRCRRGAQGLTDTLAGRFGSPGDWISIIVNGADHGPWRDTFDWIAAVGTPDSHVTCHGDPHAGNVLLDATGHWHLVDWEWSGDHHDWRMMLSHMLGSWYVSDIVRGCRGAVGANLGTLTVDYRPAPLPRLHAFGAAATGAFAQMTSPDRVEQDLGDVARHTALLLLREIPRAVRGGQNHLVGPLLGECVRLVTTRPAEHPALRMLAVPPVSAGAA